MKLPRLQFRSRALLKIIAGFAVAFWVWITYFTPAGRWHRMIRSDNESAARREAASQAIKGQIDGLEPAEAISALCMALSDPSYRVRETAASSLGGFRGPDARLAVPSLVIALKDADTTVRLRSAESLGSICCPDDDMRKIALPALIERLKDQNPEVRIAAAFSLTLMDRGEPAIPIMTAAVREGRDQDGYAALSLGLCGSSDDNAILALKRAALGSSHPKVKQAAADALARLSAAKSEPKR
jgi:HEAT repeats/HEAT repeat